ncbi:hypothetical protein A1O3_06047 [Capronia epimyces CBS 606.96]|uniref:Uncharacterized protein n=1 Tax=Capronia epimyces CBS 606.96 TaxID=1182542 RepID=W9YIW4_9EURO|nr:uncharacterized protein A1O3_06047 [Capronia epimyces CBS 606.96]EXJ82234.1 hypothetical protein A1O3_06047 [Capronia epimyces CBS 606.96]
MASFGARRQKIPRTSAGPAQPFTYSSDANSIELQPEAAIDPPLLLQTGPGDAEQEMQAQAQAQAEAEPFAFGDPTWGPFPGPFYPIVDPVPYESQIPHLSAGFWSKPADEDTGSTEPSDQTLMDEDSLYSGTESDLAFPTTPDLSSQLQVDDDIANHLAWPDDTDGQLMPAIPSLYNQARPLSSGVSQHQQPQQYPIPRDVHSPSQEQSRSEPRYVRRTESEESSPESYGPMLVRIPSRTRAALREIGQLCAEHEDPVTAYQHAIRLQRTLDPADDSHREFIERSRRHLGRRLREAKDSADRNAVVLLTVLTKTEGPIPIRLGNERLLSFVEEWPKWDAKSATSIQFLAIQKGFRYTAAWSFKAFEAFIQGSELKLNPSMVITRQKVRSRTESTFG